MGAGQAAQPHKSLAFISGTLKLSQSGENHLVQDDYIPPSERDLGYSHTVEDSGILGQQGTAHGSADC